VRADDHLFAATIRARLDGRNDLADALELEAERDEIAALTAPKPTPRRRVGDADGGKGLPPDIPLPTPAWVQTVHGLLKGL
jgi:hypothetical protein